MCASGGAMLGLDKSTKNVVSQRSGSLAATAHVRYDLDGHIIF
jgi:hypothetical protein